MWRCVASKLPGPAHLYNRKKRARRPKVRETVRRGENKDGMRRTLNHDVDCVCNMVSKMSQSEVNPRDAFEKKDSCLPLSSMSNESGVSSSLIRVPSYKNLQQTKIRTSQHTVTVEVNFETKKEKEKKGCTLKYACWRKERT